MEGIDVEGARPKNDKLDKDRFWAIVNNNIPENELTESDHRILIKRVGYLTKRERYAYKNVFVVENLTKYELDRYTDLRLDEEYFPSRIVMEAYYGDIL